MAEICKCGHPKEWHAPNAVRGGLEEIRGGGLATVLVVSNHGPNCTGGRCGCSGFVAK